MPIIILEYSVMGSDGALALFGLKVAYHIHKAPTGVGGWMDCSIFAGLGY